MQPLDPILLAQKLLQFPSITPKDEGIIDFLISYLEKYNFTCYKHCYGDVISLYAKLGDKGPNLCFLGHSDVVSPGDNWKFPPFAGEIFEGKLFGRGAVDMKSAIASFICAVTEFVNQDFFGSISLLISGNEEGNPINATPKVLQNLNDQIDACIVGEPTCPNFVGEMIKYGRRGSANFSLAVTGKQGHVAYPENAINPIDQLIEILQKLKSLKLDEGNGDFTRSNLEITDIKVNNSSDNVIPGMAIAKFNVRFNNEYNVKSLFDVLQKLCHPYILELKSHSEAFLSKKNSKLVEHMQKAILQCTGLNAVLSTTGGTSDARFIKDYCEVIEFGLVNQTAHQVDEYVALEDIILLKDIYREFLVNYFKN